MGFPCIGTGHYNMHTAECSLQEGLVQVNDPGYAIVLKVCLPWPLRVH